MTHFLKTIFTFPKADTNKSIPKLTSNDCLDLNSSLREQKEENICLTEKTNNLQSEIVSLENKNAYAEKILNVKSKTVHDCKLKLKRTAAREKYALNKIKKYEENEKNVDCCEDNKHRIAYLENELKDKGKKIHDLEESLQYLQDILNDNNNERNL